MNLKKVSIGLYALRDPYFSPDPAPEYCGAPRQERRQDAFQSTSCARPGRDDPQCRRLRAGLAGKADPHRRVIPTRRRHRHHCPRNQPARSKGHGLGLRDRQQAGRRRQPGRRFGGQVARRWQYACARPVEQPGDQPDAVRQAALRPAEGPGADRVAGQCAAGHGHGRIDALQDAGRRCQGRQGQAQPGETRVTGQRHGGAPDQRAVPEGRRSDDAARAVQGRVAGDDRRDQRHRGPVHVLGADAAGSHQAGQGARVGRHLGQARGRPSCGADHQ